MGRIYAIETFGSALGGLFAGFLLLGILGQKTTILMAVSINILLAAFLYFSKNFPSNSSKQFVEEQKVTIKKLSVEKKQALVSTFSFGFTMLGLQVICIRIFKIYLTNTSYTFALISSLIILGLFAGSWLFKKYSYKIKEHRNTMLRAFMIYGIFVGLGLFISVNMPDIIMLPFKQLLGNHFVKLILMPMIASLFIVFPPAIISGFAFPLACRMYTAESSGISESVGKIMFFNTIGSVTGPVLITFLLIPLLGVGISTILIILIVVLSTLFLIGNFKKDNLQFIMLSAISVILIGIILIKPQIRILPPSFSNVKKEVIFYNETVEASLAVSVEKNDRSEVKTTYVNNAVVIGSTYDAIKVVKMIGHLPFFAGLDCEKVLVVGFGIGVTTATIASHENVKSIDCIELAPGLKEAAKFYKDINNNIINDPRLNFIPGDGRHFLQRTSNTYDLISSDPTHPILGSANLYSLEYFELCKQHLNPGGMVSQYLPLHKLTPENFQGIIKTFHRAFPNTTVWLGHTHAILLGSTVSKKINFKEWESNIAKIGRDPVFYSNPYHLAAGLMLDPNEVSAIPEEIVINSDNRSYLEFFQPACFDPKNLNKNIQFLKDHRADVYQVFDNIEDVQQMDNFIEGNNYFINSVIYFQDGDKQQSLNELRKAVRTNPEDQEYPFLIKFYYNVPR
jgi:spermidine synthase